MTGDKQRAQVFFDLANLVIKLKIQAKNQEVRNLLSEAYRCLVEAAEYYD